MRRPPQRLSSPLLVLATLAAASACSTASEQPAFNTGGGFFLPDAQTGGGGQDGGPGGGQGGTSDGAGQGDPDGSAGGGGLDGSAGGGGGGGGGLDGATGGGTADAGVSGGGGVDDAGGSGGGGVTDAGGSSTDGFVQPPDAGGGGGEEDTFDEFDTGDTWKKPDTAPETDVSYVADIGNGQVGGGGICNPQIGAVDFQKLNIKGQLDLIIFVDTSGSMGSESAAVQNNLNKLGAFMAAKAIDYRIILIGQKKSCCPLCIQPPLGSGNCSNQSNPPVFYHVDQYVSSTNGLAKVVQTFNMWSDKLRPTSTKQFLVVTDDNANNSLSWFENELLKLKLPDGTPAFGDPLDYVFHGIFAWGNGSSKGCSTGADAGDVYYDLVKKRNGVWFPVCESDWSSMFDKLGQGVADSVKPICTYELPEVAPGVVPDPKLLNVVYAGETSLTEFPQLPNASCQDNQHGWYFEDAAQTKVALCPFSCNGLNDGGKILFDYGCP